MDMVKFEVRLSPEDGAEVLADMRRCGVVKKADYVRNSLLSQRAGRADHLAEQIGLMGLAMNDVSIALDGASPDIHAQIKPILASSSRILREINRILNSGLR